MSSASRRKTVILVGDGMGDFPCPELDGLTPLEKAATPAMDRVASRGRVFQLRTVPGEMEPGSDVANLSLLGYRPQEFYTGRAPLEAASMGVELAAGEIAFRCNLVNLDFSENTVRMVDYSAGHISTTEARELITALEREGGGVGHFYPGVSYRHLFVGKRPDHWPHTVPPHDYTGRDVGGYWQGYLDCGLAGLIRKAGRVLADHPVNRRRIAAGEKPANAIWLWGEGPMPEMAKITDTHHISGGLISAVDLLKGIGICAGLEVIEVSGATGYIDTNYQGKVDAAIAALDRHDLVFVHVEAPDETGHQGKTELKVKAIKDFDAQVVAPIVAALEGRDDRFRLVVAMDHFTPVATMTHDRTPVPLAIYAGEGEDRERRFCEKTGADAPLLADGEEFFTLLFGDDNN